MNKLNNTNKLNKITFSISIIIFLLFSCGILCQTYIEKTCLLYDNSLRFHVRADSDEKEAQERKLIVRDAILQYVKTDVEQAHSAGELKQTLAKKTKQIARIAAKAADGKPVRVYFTQERFPIRHYGAAIFPAGEYQALRIDIGKAQGHNWWCAFYPKLCYIPEKKVNLFHVFYILIHYVTCSSCGRHLFLFIFYLSIQFFHLLLQSDTVCFFPGIVLCAAGNQLEFRRFFLYYFFDQILFFAVFCFVL